MQKIFIVRESDGPKDEQGNFSRVNDFIGNTGTIISATPFGITTTHTANTGARSARNAGRILVVADDGRGQSVNL